MPTVTLKFKDNIIGEYKIEKGGNLTIGRREDNQVVVENLAVSGHHAKIDSVGDGYLLTDLQSKNGSFVNEQLVSSHWLKHADVITIGKHTLVFAYEQGETQTGETMGEMDQTMVMDTQQYRAMLNQSVSNLGAQAPEKEPLGVLSFLAGGEGEVELSKKLFKIGKKASSDILVSGLMLGQTAATISKRPNGYYLSYAGGMTKPKVNGESVKDTVKLEEFDVIELGSIKMQFFLKK